MHTATFNLIADWLAADRTLCWSVTCTRTPIRVECRAMSNYWHL